MPPLTAGYRGTRFALVAFVVYLVLTTARSLAHIVLPDGGAGTIATVDLTVTGADSIVAIFGQWGLEQLLIAALGWVIVLRYRALVPLMLLVAVADLLGRIVVGSLKPLTIIDVAPGSIGTWIALPLVALTYWLSLPRRQPVHSKSTGRSD